MVEALRHRGPDDDGQWLDEEAGIALGARRLAVMDLSPEGHMPMHSAGGRYVITYNGEVYNLAELRAELTAGGSRFRGHSDTEVLLAAVERWGLTEALRRSAGMFAFALWDRDQRLLHLVRDRMGEKPLYWTARGESLVFGSELGALRLHPAWRGEVDRGALSLLLRYGYVPAPFSIFRDVRKVPQGTILSFSHPSVQPAETVYWSLRQAAERGAGDPLPEDLGGIADRLEESLRTAVRGQMVADVPLGAFLSGGIDSSTVVALMRQESARPVRTFTIGFT
jgi:asparagine synthase (glutamine-hydrolysing)